MLACLFLLAFSQTSPTALQHDSRASGASADLVGQLPTSFQGTTVCQEMDKYCFFKRDLGVAGQRLLRHVDIAEAFGWLSI